MSNRIRTQDCAVRWYGSSDPLQKRRGMHGMWKTMFHQEPHEGTHSRCSCYNMSEEVRMKMGEVQTFIRILCKCCFLTTLGSGYCYWGALREKILATLSFYTRDLLCSWYATCSQLVLALAAWTNHPLSIILLTFISCPSSLRPHLGTHPQPQTYTSLGSTTHTLCLRLRLYTTNNKQQTTNNRRGARYRRAEGCRDSPQQHERRPVLSLHLHRVR